MDARKVVTAYVSRKQSAVSHVAAYDALDRVLDSTEKLSGLRVVIMIGSGEDEFSQTGFRDVLERAEASNVVIYSVQLGGSLAATAAALPSGFEDLEEELGFGKRSQGDVPNLARGEMFLRAVARRTGGDFYCPNCEAGYRTSVEQIIDSLDKYYRLTYTRRTEPEPGFAKLRVQAFRLDDDVRTDFDVKARQGWRF
jgi:VWFA-related protein